MRKLVLVILVILLLISFPLNISQGEEYETQSFREKTEVTSFVSPDNSYDAVTSFLNDVNHSLEVGVYQFTHPQIAQQMINLSEQGVVVRVLVEENPVQGLSSESKSVLSSLEEAGAEVKLIDYRNEYEFYHPKFMIADNHSVLLTSENFVRSSFPKEENFGNRGWGMIIDSVDLASYCKEYFEEDWDLSSEFTGVSRKIEDIEQANHLEGEYQPTYNMTNFEGEFNFTPIVGPYNTMCEKTILGMINSAEDSIYVQQYYIRNWEDKANPYLEALKEAAKRDVEVKVLLDSTWYHLEGEGNDDIVNSINDYSSSEEVDMEARLLSPYNDLEKAHNKGLIVDETQVLVSTINWNENSPTQNREVGIIVEDEEIGSYYSEIFLTDWRDMIGPIADAGENRTIDTDQEIVLSAENSWDDHEIVSYEWSIDEEKKLEKEGENITISFEEEGKYEITLLVEDRGGNIDTDTVTINVEKRDAFESVSEFMRWLVLLFPTLLISGFLLKNELSNRF